MKSLILSAIIGGLSMLTVTNSHAESGWYGGVALGQSFVSSGSDLNAVLASQGITAKSQTTCQCTGAKIFTGYAINRTFSIEGGYAKLGSTKASGAFTAPLPGGSFTDDIPATGWTLDGIASMPLPNNFSIYGRLGLVRAKVSADIVAKTPFYTVTSSKQSDTTRPHYGLGIAYDFSPRLGVRAEWETFNKIGNTLTTGQANVALYSLSAIYRF